MRRRLALWAVVLLTRIAVAEPRIVVVETRDAPSLPTLASQVELHAGRSTSVATLVARDADPMTYAERASQLVASGEATVVVWIAPVDRGFLVFAAGRWPGRALVELVRVPDDVGAAELERTIALKLAGLLDAVLRPEVTPGAALAIAAASPGTAQAISAAAPAVWRIEVGGAVARESHQRGLDGRVGLAGSRTWLRGRWNLAPTLAGYWQPTGAIEGDRGRASVTELGAAAALEAGLAAGASQVFARPRFVAAVLVAEGTSSDGRHGEALVLAPYVGVELGVRRAISEAVSVGLVAGGDLALIHHELLIDGETIVDLGRVRLHVGVSLTMSL